MRREEQGMTLIGMLMTIVIVVFVGVIIMRVVPIYIENYEIKHAINGLRDVPADKLSLNTQSNVQVLKTNLMNQLYISGVDAVERDDVKITPIDRNRYKINLDYTAQRTLMGNISILIEFKEELEININAP